MENKKNYLILPIDLDEYKPITTKEKEEIFEFAKFLLKKKKRKIKEE